MAENTINRVSEDNIARLARVLQSEVSVGNETERNAVGWTLLNRMNRNGTNAVRDVDGAYSRNQEPTSRMRELAGRLLRHEIPDPTNGATHYYSPRSMPHEDTSIDGYDVGGGLEQIEGLQTRTYRPSWTIPYQYSDVAGVRPSYYRFYVAPGSNAVR